MTACGHSIPKSELPKIPANLDQDCDDLQEITDGTGRALAPWALETIKSYKVCALRAKSLRDAWPK